MNRLAFWLVTLTMTFGCAQKAAGPNQPAQGMAEMDFNGMKVRAEGTNPGVWAVGNMEGITVTVGGKKIVIEKERRWGDESEDQRQPFARFRWLLHLQPKHQLHWGRFLHLQRQR